MDSPGLPQIEEGFEHLDISSPRRYPSVQRNEPDYITFKDASQIIARKDSTKHTDDAQIYSDTSIVIHKAHNKNEKTLIEEGLKKLSDKYESLERVKPQIPGGGAAGESESMGSHPKENSYTFIGQTITHDELNDNRSPSPLPIDHNPCETGLSDQDILQTDMFYRSHKSDVYVCPTLANLYFGTVKTSGPVDMARLNDWVFVRTGIPVLVLDSGESRRQRKLHIVLAERGTGFTLWRDQINHLTNYSAPHVSYHTMHMSSDHTRIAGFSYDDSGAASDFMHKIRELTSDPDDDILNLSRSSRGKKHKDKKMSKKKYKAPNKADISQPCCFTHITKIDRPEVSGDLQPGPPLPPQGSVSTASIQRRNSGVRQEQVHTAAATASH